MHNLKLEENTVTQVKTHIPQLYLVICFKITCLV